MEANYLEIRTQEIFTSLQEHIPVTHSGMSPKEKLHLLQKFANAFTATVFSPAHAKAVTLHNLYYYLQEQAAGLGLDQDFDIQAACYHLDSLCQRIRLLTNVVSGSKALPSYDTDYEYVQSCELFATVIAKLELASANIFK